jgi:hypothetical protein
MAIEPIEDSSPSDVTALPSLDQLHAEREARFAVIDRFHARARDVPEAEVLEDIAIAIAAVRAARRQAPSNAPSDEQTAAGSNPRLTSETG